MIFQVFAKIYSLGAPVLYNVVMGFSDKRLIRAENYVLYDILLTVFIPYMSLCSSATYDPQGPCVP